MKITVRTYETEALTPSGGMCVLEVREGANKMVFRPGGDAAFAVSIEDLRRAIEWARNEP